MRAVRWAYRRLVRAFLTPKWLAAHLLLIVACAAMIRLGIWQWHVGGLPRGDVRNYAYAVQWWAFTGFAVFFWARLIRDARLRDVPAPPVQEEPSQAQYRRYTMPQSQEITDSAADPERARYNAYLRSLEEQ
jgi:TRAP-type C4-dicarboxylate transport system permease small subunit